MPIIRASAVSHRSRRRASSGIDGLRRGLVKHATSRDLSVAGGGSRTPDGSEGRRDSSCGHCEVWRTGNSGMVGPGDETDSLFVGREREMEILAAGLRDARAGRTRFVLVSGEAGIGKTRMVE